LVILPSPLLGRVFAMKGRSASATEEMSMLRRAYYVIPDVSHARPVVDELQAAGIEKEQMHAWSKAGRQLRGLPVATEAQGRDRVWMLDKLLWSADLMLFCVAAVGLLLAAVSGSLGWVFTALALMGGAFVVGRWFSVKVPHTHLADMRVPLAHGEVVLMVDVPRERIGDVEELVRRHHPEAHVGGIGSTSPILGT
jgi:hypothetical protein